MNNLEIEVKFYLNDIHRTRDSIVKLGAINMGRVFEHNIRFEDSDKNLIKKKSLLRLRKDKTAKLTFKSLPEIPDPQFKVLRELELEVSDFSTMRHILEALGFHAEQVYEKWRETFVLNSTQFCIDTMPYGNFLEIEGERETIKELASTIGLKWEKRILLNYLEIFDILKRKHSFSFSDVTFANFENVKIELSPDSHFF